MKLVFCAKCYDVLKFTTPPEAPRTCGCGESAGAYLTGDKDETRSVITGKYAQVIAIGNEVLWRVMQRVVPAKPDNPGLDHYVGVDDYYVPQNQIHAWVYGPNAREVTRNTTLATPKTESDTTELRKAKSM